MRSFARLRREIFLAIAIAAPAAGCTKDGQGAGDKPAPPPAQADAAETVADDPPPPPPPPVDAAVVAEPEPKPDPRLPRCPEGDFCTTAKAAKKVAKKGEYAEVKDGCATPLEKPPEPRPEGVPEKQQLWITMNEPATKAKRDAGDKEACCYTWTIPCPGGRPLVVDGGTRVAPVVRGRGWEAQSLAGEVQGLPPALRQALAEAWLADALAEHASVASFARAALELMAVGAPPDLVAAHHAAALDEIRHARICFALAGRYGARVAPGPLPAPAPRGGGLARLARDTFFEGCAGETVAALVVADGAAGCADEQVAKALRRIAADERRHAALAWQTVAWTVVEGGEPVRSALREAAAEAEDGPGAGAGAGIEAETWLAHGRLDDAAQRRVRADAWKTIIRPALARMGV